MSKPKSPSGNIYSTELSNDLISFDIEAFDNAIRNQGVTLVHWRAMACPVGMIDEFDTRRPHEDHSGCSNGFIYTEGGLVTILFTGNTLNSSSSEVGFMNGSVVNVTFPRFYDRANLAEPEIPIHIAPFDRLYFHEKRVVVPHWQRFRTNGTSDKLQFPIVQVQDLIDSNNKRYSKADFDLVDGRLVWSTSNRPGVDPQSGKGLICSARFLYRPYFYIKNLVHQVRVTQAENPMTGERETFRMPQAAVLEREYIFEKNDKDSADTQRQVAVPDGLIFGPR